MKEIKCHRLNIMNWAVNNYGDFIMSVHTDNNLLLFSRGNFNILK